MQQNPEARPKKLKNTPAPLIHTKSKTRRKAFMEAYRAHVEAFYRAQEDLVLTIVELNFPPEGCWPAGIPGGPSGD